MILPSTRVFLPLLLLAFSNLAFSECKYEPQDEQTEGRWIVKVAPIYPSRQLRKGIEACVVLGYALKVASDDPSGRHLKPADIVVLSSTERDAKAFIKASKNALSRWLFTIDANPPSDNVTYYSIFPFEIEER